MATILLAIIDAKLNCGFEELYAGVVIIDVVSICCLYDVVKSYIQRRG